MNPRIHHQICLATTLVVATGCLLPCQAQNVPTAAVHPILRTAASNSVFDAEAHGIPRFVEADYIDLSRIASISKFRSGEGHDYSDDFESCRSMKHYFKPRADIDWATVRLFSPVTGVIVRIEEERAGTKLDIQVDKFPAFIVSIFHVKLIAALRPGDKVAAGQILGTHIGRQTYSDVAVCVNTPKGRKLVSYFDVMSSRVFQGYRARGLASQDVAIISKESRDADPLSCQGDKFTSRSHGQDWIVLSEIR